MTKRQVDFKTTSSSKAEKWYDIYDDWDLIESSIAKQYGIRIRRNLDMPWTEFCALLSGLMPDTPLGSIIEIRSEKDPKVIKGFNQHQKKIYNDWKLKRAQDKLKDPKKLEQEMLALEKAFERLFSKKQ